jgi:hypothetical protein
VIRIEATVDAEQATDAFKHARRDIYRRAKSGIKAAGERTILLRARAGMRSKSPVVSSQLVVKTTARDGYLTAKSAKQGRIVGLLNYGGTVKDPIVPKDKKALAFAGIVVSQVNRQRRYRGSHFLEKARDEGLDEFGAALLPEILLAFEPLDHTP